jgi:hypothetical protein
MATVTLRVVRTFPAGTTVDVYLASQRYSDQAPAGQIAASDVVDAGGNVTFSGLDNDTAYVAYALVDNTHRYTSFATPPLAGGGGGGAGGGGTLLQATVLDSPLVVRVGDRRIPIPGGEIQWVRAMVSEPPVNSDVVLDVNLNGTTIFTTQANRPTIPGDANDSGECVPDVTTTVDGDYLTLDIDQIGGGVGGAGDFGPYAQDNGGGSGTDSSGCTAALKPVVGQTVVFAGQRTGLTAAAAELDVDVTAPAGSAVGDVVMVHLECLDTATMTLPTGWTLIQSGVVGTGWKDVFAWHRIGDNGPGDVPSDAATVHTFTASAGWEPVAMCVAYRNAIATGNPIDDSAFQASVDGAVTTFPQVTSTVANALIVLMGGTGEPTAVMVTPDGFTARYSTNYWYWADGGGSGTGGAGDGLAVSIFHISAA